MADLVIPTPGENVWPFKLGDEVRDKITGLTGVLMNRFYHLSGCDRFAFEPAPLDNKLADPVHVAAERLELVAAHPDRHRDEVPDATICLGDVVRDKVTGIQGKASIWNVPLHGAMQIAIEPGYNHKELRMSETYFVDEHLVEVITPLNPKPADEAPVPKKKERGAMRMPSNFTR